MSNSADMMMRCPACNTGFFDAIAYQVHRANCRLENMRSASYLLPAPGGEVVRDLLDHVAEKDAEIVRLREWISRVVYDDSLPLRDETRAIGQRILNGGEDEKII